jgi:hypothetical protein
LNKEAREMTDGPGSEHEAQTSKDGITRRKLVGTGVAAAGAAIVWGSPFPFSRKGIGQSIDTAHAAPVTGTTGGGGHGDEPTAPPAPARAAYCAAAGNTFPDGTPVAVGTFLNLLFGQPDTDPHYKGATLANYVEGKGLTCDPPPTGFVRDGFAHSPDVPPDLYPFWRKP